MTDLTPEEFAKFKKFAEDKFTSKSGKLPQWLRGNTRNSIRKTTNEEELKACLLDNKLLLSKIDYDSWFKEFLEQNKTFVSDDKNEEDPEQFLKDLKESQNSTNLVRISGVLHDGYLFWVTFMQKDGKFIPIVFTGNPKKYALEVRKEKDSSFFEYEGYRYKVLTPLYYKDAYKINIPSKNILDLANFTIKKEDLYEHLLKLIKEYYDHSEEKEYDLAIPFIVVSYIGFGLGRTYYYIIQGIEDTGKSTLQRIFASLQMNGWFGGKASFPVMARLLHCFSISANQDEFEKMNPEVHSDY